MNKVILDGNKLYEIDEECMKEKRQRKLQYDYNEKQKDNKKKDNKK